MNQDGNPSLTQVVSMSSIGLFIATNIVCQVVKRLAHQISQYVQPKLTCFLVRVRIIDNGEPNWHLRLFRTRKGAQHHVAIVATFT